LIDRLGVSSGCVRPRPSSQVKKGAPKSRENKTINKDSGAEKTPNKNKTASAERQIGNEARDEDRATTSTINDDDREQSARTNKAKRQQLDEGPELGSAVGSTLDPSPPIFPPHTPPLYTMETSKSEVPRKAARAEGANIADARAAAQAAAATARAEEEQSRRKNAQATAALARRKAEEQAAQAAAAAARAEEESRKAEERAAEVAAAKGRADEERKEREHAQAAEAAARQQAQLERQARLEREAEVAAATAARQQAEFRAQTAEDNMRAASAAREAAEQMVAQMAAEVARAQTAQQAHEDARRLAERRQREAAAEAKRCASEARKAKEAAEMRAQMAEGELRAASAAKEAAEGAVGEARAAQQAHDTARRVAEQRQWEAQEEAKRYAAVARKAAEDTERCVSESRKTAADEPRDASTPKQRRTVLTDLLPAIPRGSRRQTRVDDEAPPKRTRSEARRNAPHTAVTTPIARRESEIAQTPPQGEVAATTFAARAPLRQAASVADEWIDTAPLAQLAPGGKTRLFFDGGARDVGGERRVAHGVWLSDVAYWATALRNGTAQTAEVAGSVKAMQLARRLIKRGVLHVEILGDSHNTISVLETGAVAVLCTPGRSAIHASWSEADVAKRALEADAMQAGATVAFRWVPRAANQKADEVATATLEARAANLAVTPQVDEATLLKIAGQPREEDLEAILSALVAAGGVRCFRSLPPALSVAWKAVVTKVAVWGQLALLLAPAVLLQKRGAPLHVRLPLLATKPGELESFFAAAKMDGFGVGLETVTQQTQEDKNKLVEKLAAFAPGRAVKILRGGARADLNDPKVVEAVAEKIGAGMAPPSEMQQVPPTLGVNFCVPGELVKTAAGMAKAASPGPDGWTRELFVTSWTASAAEVWVMLANRAVHGTLPLEWRALMCAASVAAWPKEPGSPKLRVIGCTSFILKLCWRLAVARHLRRVKPQQFQCGVLGAGLFSAVRWAQSEIAAGRDVEIADVADAFYKLDRVKAGAILIDMGSPLAHLFKWVYDGPLVAWCGNRPLPVNRGLLPGCGGAAVVFCCVVQVPKDSPTYVDDLAYQPHRRAEIVTGYAAQGFELAKFRLAGKSHATRFLGAYIGNSDVAAKLFADDVQEQLQHMRAIVAHEGISLQAKFVMCESVLAVLDFRFAATEPHIVRDTGARVDEALFTLLCAFAGVDPARATAPTRSLLASPFMGAGWGHYGSKAATLFDMASVPATWPPNLIAEKQPVWKMKREMHEALRASEVKAWGVYAKERVDATQSWFRIRRTAKHFQLDDDEFRNMFQNMVRIPTDRSAENCPKEGWETQFDHGQCCRCAAWSWTPRHELVLGACRRSAVTHGCQASVNFYDLYGVQRGRATTTDEEKKNPDLIFFRSHVDKCPLVVDFTICHPLPSDRQDKTEARATAKSSKYADWKGDCAEVVPLVLTSLATLPDRSLAVLQTIEKEAAVRRGFAYDASARMKIALVKWDLFRKLSRRSAGDTV